LKYILPWTPSFIFESDHAKQIKDEQMERVFEENSSKWKNKKRQLPKAKKLRKCRGKIDSL
jgi:hypothetical protein